MIIPINNEQDLMKYLKSITQKDPQRCENGLTPEEELFATIVDDREYGLYQYIESREDQIKYLLQKIREHNRKEKLEKLLS